jgi:hypothetical protein
MSQAKRVKGQSHKSSKSPHWEKQWTTLNGAFNVYVWRRLDGELLDFILAIKRLIHSLCALNAVDKDQVL